MMGRTHATSGVVLALASVPLLNSTIIPFVAAHTPLAIQPVTGWGVPVMAVAAAGGAMLPDFDHRHATIAQSLGPATKLVAVGIETVSGGHRNGTHSLLGVAAFTTAAWALAHLGGWPLGIWLGFLFAVALKAVDIPVARSTWVHTLTCLAGGVGLVWLSGYVTLPLLATVVGVAVGSVAHLLGDMLTKEGCPLLWPVNKTRFHVLSLTTDHFGERVIIGPLLGVVAVAQVAYLSGMWPWLVTGWAFVSQTGTWLSGLVADLRHLIEL